MRIIFEEPIEFSSLDPEVSEDDKLPTCDVRKRSLTAEEITRHIKNFSHGFWNRESNPIGNDEKLIDDIEQSFRRRVCDIPEHESAYGHIGGIPDYGLCSYFFLNNLDDSFGITGHTTYKWNQQSENYLMEISNNHQAIREIKKAAGKFSFVVNGRRCQKIQNLLGQNTPLTDRNHRELDLSLEQIEKIWSLLTVDSPVHALLDKRQSDMTFGTLIDWYIEFFLTQGKLKKQV